MNIKEVVDDPQWQALRKGMVGSWMIYPVLNVKNLRIYLGDMSDPLRLRRVHNYLTGSGFRMGRIRHPEIDKLLNEIRQKRSERR